MVHPPTGGGRRWSSSLIAALVVSLVLPIAAGAAPGPGLVQQRAYGRGYAARIYTPRDLDRSVPAPLVVMLHGCNWSAERQEAALDLDFKAEAAGFVVLYADFDPARTPRCWRARADTARGSDDPAAIAGMVRDTVRRRSPPIDRTRIYAAGVSSGAMMTVVLGATYPDLFAAIAVNAGCAYRAGTCIDALPSRRTRTLAREALRAQGPHRRALPVLIIHGDRDATVPFAHSRQLLAQWRMTDNLILSGEADRPIRRQPTGVRQVVTADGRSATVKRYGALIERWTIHGGTHCWQSVSADPAHAGASPDTCDAVWAFLCHFRMPSVR